MINLRLSNSEKAIMIIGLIITLASFSLIGTKYFFFIVWIGVLIGVSPLVFKNTREVKEMQEKEVMFLEFTRNLVESVKTGTSISKTLVNLKKKNYGSLTKHVEKLANQISIGIPLRKALEIFAKDINDKNISRTITLIGQAEVAGGNISSILEEVAKATTLTDKLKKERRASISSIVTQGYIIFFVFTIIVLVMQFYIIPMLSGITSTQDLSSSGGIPGVGGAGVSSMGSVDPSAISKSFLFLLLFQGGFTGLVIGKLADGKLRTGIKHSFALVTLSFLIATIANVVLAK